MSSDKVSANISLKTRKIPLNEHLLKTTLSEVFPIVCVNFQKDTKKQDYCIDVRIGSKIYDFITDGSLTERVLMYIVPASSQLGFWTPDMIIGFELLSSLGIIEEISSWISKGRDALTNYLINDKVNSVRKDSLAMKKAEEMLVAFGILDTVNSKELLPVLVKNAVEARRLDPTTIIFRLAMAIYHARTNSDQSVIDEIEDPSSLYLKLSQSDYFKENSAKLAIFGKMPIEAVNPVTKFLAVMAIAAYVYHKTVGEK
jgi:hypothetical protein